MAFGQGAVVAAARTVLTVDDRQHKRGLKQAERDVDSFGKTAVATMGNWAKAAALTAGAAGIGALVIGAKSAVTAASNLGEQINKTRVVFRGSEQGILSWAKTTAQSLGISNRAALEATGTFGNMLVPIGFARSEAAEMSKRMVELAADMASFNNADPSEVLEALRSGLAGETEPLRRFGIFLSDARLKQEALTMGLYDGKGALDANAKAAATYAVILKDTKDAQGDFSRTSDSLANQQRIMNAQWEDAQAKLGKLLLPVVLRFVTELNTLIARLSSSKEAQELLNEAMDTGEQVVRGVVGAMRDLAPMVLGAAKAIDTAVDAIGGWETAAKFALGTWIFVKLSSLAGAFRALAGAQGIAAATGALGTGKGGLLGALNALPRRKTITVVVGVAFAAGAYEVLKTVYEGFGANYEGTETGAGTYQRDGWITDATGRRRAYYRNGKMVPGTEQIYRNGKWVPSGGAANPGGGLPAGVPPPPGSGRDGTGSTGDAGVDAILGTAYEVGPGSGITYTWGGATPEVGFDCSGYLYYVYGKNGVRIPRTTRTQWADRNAVRVPKGQERPGDGVYFVGSNSGANAGPPPGHCGLYIGGGKYIEYFSRGKPAKVSRLSHRSDYMGARRWIKVKQEYDSDGGSGSGSGGATGSDTAGDDKTPPLIPPALEEKLARAELTPKLRDDLRALEGIESYLEKRIAKEKDVNKRLALLRELKQVRDRIAAVRDEIDGVDPGEGDLIPMRFRLALAKAEATINRNDDDLRVLRQIERYLEKRLKSEKDVNAKIEILQELANVRRQIAAIEGETEGDSDLIPDWLQDELASAEETEGFDDDIATLTEIEEYLERRIAKEKSINTKLGLLKKLRDVRKQLRSAKDAKEDEEISGIVEPLEDEFERIKGGGRGSRVLKGRGIDPVTGEVTFEITSNIEDLKAYLAYLFKVLEKLDKEILAVTKAIQRLEQNPRTRKTPNGRAQLARLRAKLKLLKQERAELVALIKSVQSSLSELEAAANAPPEPEGASAGAEGGVPEEPSEGDAGGGGPTAAEQIRAYLAGETEIFKSYASNVIAAAFAGGMGSLGDITYQPGGGRSGGAGGNVTVNNYYARGPEDPHLWSKALEFDLKALVA